MNGWNANHVVLGCLFFIDYYLGEQQSSLMVFRTLPFQTTILDESLQTGYAMPGFLDMNQIGQRLINLEY